MTQPQRQPSPSLDEEQGGQSGLHLHLRLPEWDTPRVPPSRLARALGLHLYSAALLGKRARIEMNFAAVILLIVTAFELVAWTFLFNSIFNSDILYLGFRTIPAVLIASLFAAAVFWFERQFLTHDEERRGRVVGAAVVRLFFIVMSAIITAQPLELLFFREPIEERVHEEGIRVEAVERLAELREDLAREDKFDTRIAERQATSLEALEGKLVSAQRRKATRESELAGARSSLPHAREEVRRLERQKQAASLSSEVYKETDRLHRAALQRVGALSAAIGRLEPLVAADKLEIESLGGEIDVTTGDIKELEEARRQKEERIHKRLRNWVRKLRQAAPRTTIAEGQEKVEACKKPPTGSAPADQPWCYDDPEYNFFEQLRVVWNLVAGRPAQWTRGTLEIQRTLETNFGFTATEVAEGMRLHYLLPFVACHLIALFIPLLVLVIKLVLMPQELRNYYSSRHQAEAGDVDAWLTQAVTEKIRGRASGFQEGSSR